MDPNLTDDQGMPLLVLAAREKSDKVAAALVANPKTNIEISDKAGENAMMLAALNGDMRYGATAHREGRRSQQEGLGAAALRGRQRP